MTVSAADLEAEQLDPKLFWVALKPRLSTAERALSLTLAVSRLTNCSIDSEVGLAF